MAIRFMRSPAGRRAIFAKGNMFENIYLWFRGYRRHDTLVGWVMAKFADKEAK